MATAAVQSVRTPSRKMPSTSSMVDDMYEVMKYYRIHETLGTGGFAKVKRAVHILTGENVAIKIMDKKSLGKDLPRVKREIEALKVLHHQYIARLYQVIETPNKIFLILEYCPGGELFDYIVDRNRLTEREAIKYMRQLLSALGYIHSMGYCHRDLKPENILLMNGGASIKLIDFGLCARIHNDNINSDDLNSSFFTTTTANLLRSACGSPAYAAPELVEGRPYYGDRVDIWSSGVILYALLVGQLPFDVADTNNNKLLYQKIRSGKYQTPSFLSKDAARFISVILKTDPEIRIGYNKMISDPWITKKGMLGPVDYSSKTIKTKIDFKIIRKMEDLLGMDGQILPPHLKDWDNYDDFRAYYLLIQKAGVLNPSISRRLPLIRSIMSSSISNLAKVGDENTPPSGTTGASTNDQNLPKSRLVCDFVDNSVPTACSTLAKGAGKFPDLKLAPLSTVDMENELLATKKSQGFYSSTSDMEQFLTDDETGGREPNPIVPEPSYPQYLNFTPTRNARNAGGGYATERERVFAKFEQMLNTDSTPVASRPVHTAATERRHRTDIISHSRLAGDAKFATPQPPGRHHTQFARRLRLANPALAPSGSPSSKVPATVGAPSRRPPRRSRTPPTNWPTSPQRSENNMPSIVEVCTPKKQRPGVNPRPVMTPDVKNRRKQIAKINPVRRSISGAIETASPKPREPLTPICIAPEKSNKFLASIERGLSKMKNRVKDGRLTPGNGSRENLDQAVAFKPNDFQGTPTRNSSQSASARYSMREPYRGSFRSTLASRQARHVTSLVNVSHLSYKPAEWLLKQVIGQISQHAYIQFRCKRFTVRCQLLDDGINHKHDKQMKGINLDFEIEIVRLAEAVIEQARQKQLQSDLAHTSDKAPRSGVKRRRLKGDTFLYKKICNEILSQIDQSMR